MCFWHILSTCDRCGADDDTAVAAIAAADADDADDADDTAGDTADAAVGFEVDIANQYRIIYFVNHCSRYKVNM